MQCLCAIFFPVFHPHHFNMSLLLCLHLLNATFNFIVFNLACCVALVVLSLLSFLLRHNSLFLQGNKRKRQHMHVNAFIPFSFCRLPPFQPPHPPHTPTPVHTSTRTPISTCSYASSTTGLQLLSASWPFLFFMVFILVCWSIVVFSPFPVPLVCVIPTSSPHVCSRVGLFCLSRFFFLSFYSYKSK